MLFAASGLIGRPVDASDGRIGAVRDFLLDQRGWAVRWMVVDPGPRLPGRKVLIHPSAVAPIHLPPRPAFPMLSFGEEMAVSVGLTLRQVEGGPDAREDEPLTGQLEQRLFDHFGWDPFWSAPLPGSEAANGRSSGQPAAPPHLCSAAALKGFEVFGADGKIGSVDNVFLDDAGWAARCLVVATGGWLTGKLVQLPLRAVRGIDGQACSVTLDVSRDQVDSAPAWDPVAMVGEIKR